MTKKRELSIRSTCLDQAGPLSPCSSWWQNALAKTGRRTIEPEFVLHTILYRVVQSYLTIEVNIFPLVSGDFWDILCNMLVFTVEFEKKKFKAVSFSDPSTSFKSNPKINFKNCRSKQQDYVGTRIMLLERNPTAFFRQKWWICVRIFLVIAFCNDRTGLLKRSVNLRGINWETKRMEVREKNYTPALNKRVLE